MLNNSLRNLPFWQTEMQQLHSSKAQLNVQGCQAANHVNSWGNCWLLSVKVSAKGVHLRRRRGLKEEDKRVSSSLLTCQGGNDWMCVCLHLTEHLGVRWVADTHTSNKCVVPHPAFQRQKRRKLFFRSVPKCDRALKHRHLIRVHPSPICSSWDIKTFLSLR